MKIPKLDCIESITKLKFEVFTYGNMADGYLNNDMNKKGGHGTGKLFRCMECN